MALHMDSSKGRRSCNHRREDINGIVPKNVTKSTKNKDQVLRKLCDTFQDVVDLELIESVARTCNLDLGKSTEVLMVLTGSAHVQQTRTRRMNSLAGTSISTRAKTKSLPSTLKSHKASNGALSDCSTKSMPNGLRPRPEHLSSDSISSGQVWQRHYKSKPQSPGLLTMIPPSSKELVKNNKTMVETPEAKRASATILTIEQLIKNNVKVCILMRGAPGSGKTHLAQFVVRLVSKNDFSQHIFSTDDYFIMLGRGNYAYDPNLVSQAHHWNQKRVYEALKRATNPVIVDNTNVQAWEMRPYVTMAIQHGYLIEVLEPATPWRNKESELAKRNAHSVPREKIRQMLDRYEPGWTGQKLISLFKLKYTPCGGTTHVSQEVGNSPLSQHRQQVVEQQPEKPRRRTDKGKATGDPMAEQKEKQLEELNQLFAEYGTHMDAVSKQKVLDSGVPVSEIVARMRKLQGTVLPLPKSKNEDTIPKKPDYLSLSGHRGESPTESVEPDTMSSSNVSETSDCETEDEDENHDFLKQHLVGNQNENWDDVEVKSEGRGSEKPNRYQQPFTTSSQEELSIIDYQVGTPMCSSQDELSIIDYGGQESPSSSSEEQKTERIAERKDEERHFKPIEGTESEVEINNSLMEILKRRYDGRSPEAVSPDLESIPLPSIPMAKPKKESKLETIEESSVEKPEKPKLPKKPVPKKDRSPEEIIKNFDLNWASIPFTSSWDTPPPILKPKPQRKQIVSKTVSTQTGDPTCIAVLTAVSRSINDEHIVVPVRPCGEIPMFDKSSMTNDEEDDYVELSDNSVQTLLAIFPTVSEDHIKDMLVQCQNNVAWVAELLSDPGFSTQHVPDAPLPPPPTTVPLEERLTIINDGKKTIRRRKKTDANEMHQLLKKEIENSIRISEDHYSDKTLFLKKMRSGEISLDGEEELPQLQGDVAAAVVGETAQEETVPLALDPSFLEDLSARLGVPTKDNFMNYKPVVHLPMQLAEQIYWHWVESMNEQVLQGQYFYEAMLKDDEMLATALQEAEHEERSRTFMDNVDEQLAESLSNRERIMEARTETVASKLAQQILFESYPHVDRNVLLDTFKREGCSLTRTQEVLSAKYEATAAKCVSAPEMAFERSLLDSRTESKPMIKVAKRADSSNVLVVDPSEFRRKIQELQDRRLDYCHQGQEALRKKNFSTASYFFQTARSLKEKIKELQQSSISLKLFEEKPRSLATTLDLHFLFIPETVQILDLFIDHHLREMTGNKLEIYLITGRGQRSFSGKSKIKPVVRKRLEQRQLTFIEDNPGMFKVILKKSDALSSVAAF